MEERQDGQEEEREAEAAMIQAKQVQGNNKVLVEDEDLETLYINAAGGLLEALLEALLEFCWRRCWSSAGGSSGGSAGVLLEALLEFCWSSAGVLVGFMNYFKIYTRETS